MFFLSQEIMSRCVSWDQEAMYPYPQESSGCCLPGTGTLPAGKAATSEKDRRGEGAFVDLITPDTHPPVG
jgi:hypothetical protein